MNYLAVNFLGWQFADTPWEAISKLTLGLRGTKPKVGSKQYEKETKGISLYLVDESQVDHFDFFQPRDKNGNLVGQLIYPLPEYGRLRFFLFVKISIIFSVSLYVLVH